MNQSSIKPSQSEVAVPARVQAVGDMGSARSAGHVGVKRITPGVYSCTVRAAWTAYEKLSHATEIKSGSR